MTHSVTIVEHTYAVVLHQGLQLVNDDSNGILYS
jgi:hypothetical protein